MVLGHTHHFHHSFYPLIFASILLFLPFSPIGQLLLYRKMDWSTEASGPVVRAGFPSLPPEFKFQHIYLLFLRYFIYLLGLQGIEWIQKLIVVCMSWPGHPGYQKKKKDGLNILSFFKKKFINSCSVRWLFFQIIFTWKYILKNYFYINTVEQSKNKKKTYLKQKN